jgi:hypothetical protein
MTTHEIKCHPAYFEALLTGAKPFEVRFNDRQYTTLDRLYVREFSPEGYTGRAATFDITFILRDFPGLQPGYVVLGLKRVV